MPALSSRCHTEPPHWPLEPNLPPDFNPYIVEPDFWSAFGDDEPPPEPDHDDFDIEPNYDSDQQWPETD